MLDRPSIVCRVVRPILSPLVATPGDYLTGWPGHPTHTLAVVTSDQTTVVRHRFCADGALYGLLLDLFLDGKVRLTDQAQRRLLSQTR
jgi:hypothetical protein